MRALQSGVERVAPVGGMIVADRAARLHGDGGDPVDHKAMLDAVRRARKGGIGRRLIADQLDETDIVGAIVPHARRVCARRRGGGGDRRQRLVVHLDQLSGIKRLRHGLGHHEGHTVAEPAHAILRQDRIARLVLRRAVAPLEATWNGQIAVAGRLHVGASEYGQDAGRGFGRRNVERLDPGVRVRRAQHHAMHQAGQLDVVGIAAAALDQPRILEARHALTDCEFAHGSVLPVDFRNHRTVTRREESLGVQPFFNFSATRGAK